MLREYALRFKNATPAELFYRLRQTAFVMKLKQMENAERRIASLSDISKACSFWLQLPAINIEAGHEEIQAILSGKTFCLNSPKDLLDSFDRRSRNTLFAKIDIRGGFPDVRASWEQARLQHVTIMLAYLINNPDAEDAAQVRGFARQTLLAWIHENPFPYGVHYVSVMECGLRIPVFFLALRLLELSEIDFDTISRTVFIHAWWIANRLSLHSSRGNHTICECVGLIFAGAIFKNGKFGDKWLRTGFDLLEKELAHQILDDGGPCEQSFRYHRFILDLVWFAVDFAEKNNLRECGAIRQRLLLGEAFLSAFVDEKGNFPLIGDSDDGHALAPGISPARRVPVTKGHTVQVFKTAGYTAIRWHEGSLLTFDHGPLGMPPLFNHGHADALSITLTIGGEPLLVDPGTYRYNGDADFRRYFKATTAHNTVAVDGQDQAVQETGFIWSRPFTSRLVRASERPGGFIVEAMHDGYARLQAGPVYHRRSIQSFTDKHFLCTDIFSGFGTHDFQLNFHFHPDARIGRLNKWWKIEKGNEKVSLKLLGHGDFTLVETEENPPFAWFSPSYGIKRPSRALCLNARGLPGDIHFTTLICIGTGSD